MAALTSFALLRNFARTGRTVASVRPSPKLSPYPTSINFLTANPPRRFVCRASAKHDEEAAAKAAAVNADTGAPTIFDKIIAKEIPSAIVYEDDKVLAFKDINPQAPVHVLVIPKFRDGLTELGKAEPRHEEILGQLLYAARIVAEKEGIVDGFRVVINSGASACQSVYHFHLHVIGGRQMKWPPG
ncbi:Histidine triad (HIT) protein [Corchorus capsularis]|uniref:Histidine triad (HIT) protein n=1 Tax=Corchorus capsularis TaxID=210143 RepID=A0A1R3HXC1_COCAP|nr:Histidine triad (HIT) protein [Corchorus capsularis]